MHRPTLPLAPALCSLALFVPAICLAQSPSRDEVLAFFLQANAQTNVPSAPAAPPTPPAADALQPMLGTLEQITSKNPDEALLRALFEYQLTHPGANEPRPALAIGRLYWAQPKAFLATFRSLPAPQQRRLMPYVEFGWKQCIRGKVKSGRHFQQLQQDMDRLGASMINARGHRCQSGCSRSILGTSRQASPSAYLSATMPSVFIKTYGCQMNERDSEQVARMLQAKGYDLATEERGADVILINTCSVRDQAEQKALGKMGLLSHLKRERPGLVLGFMGCMAQSRGHELVDRLPDVDLVLGTQQFHRAADCIDILRSQFDGARRPIVDVSESPGSESTIRDHVLRPRQATAFVSIMQGCDMSCAYCIVPATRGRERSRPIPEIVREVEALVASGVREVTLLGQIVNLYGRHEFPPAHGRSPFVQLLHAIDRIPGLERIRFTSPHPAGLKEDLVNAYSELPKLCEHMHLPVQSGSNRILRAMRRSYTREIFLRKVAALRAVRPDIALTTDIIVAFPGETEEDFLQTCSLAEEVRFDNAFIFRYSDRRDTPAASMDGQLPEDVKQARNQRLLEIVNRIARETLASAVGSTQQILVEGPSKTNTSRLAGRTRHNRIAVFEGDERLRGSILSLHITRNSDHTLYGEPIP